MNSRFEEPYLWGSRKRPSHPIPTKEEQIAQVERAIAEYERKIAALATRTGYYHPSYPDTLQWYLDYFQKRLEELRQ
jgi:hypothetical protein